jgi:hypothetical protein
MTVPNLAGGMTSIITWTYTSDKEFKMSISEDKDLTIEKIAKVDERKF